ncbi:MAG: flippase-like domain-containing protein [Thauera sp.]|nr:flippase-like domain-containing protein [Thauera sp.]
MPAPTPSPLDSLATTSPLAPPTPRDSAPPHTPCRIGARRLQPLIRVAASLGLLAAVLLWLEPQTLAAAFSAPEPMWLAAALALSFPQVALSAWRWRLTAQRLGAPIRFGEALREYYVATFLNQILPGGVMGDAARAWRHARRPRSEGVLRGPVGEAVGESIGPAVGTKVETRRLMPLGAPVETTAGAPFEPPFEPPFETPVETPVETPAAAPVGLAAWHAVLIERASGQLALLAVVLATLVVSPELQGTTARMFTSPDGGSNSPVTLALALLLALAGIALWRGRGHVARFRRAVQEALLARDVFLRQLVASLLIVASYVGVYLCCMRMIGIDTPLATAAPLVPWVLLAMAIPLSIAGWGVREGAAALVWQATGLDPAQGVAISISYGVVILLSSLPGALMLLRRGPEDGAPVR